MKGLRPTTAEGGIANACMAVVLWAVLSLAFALFTHPQLANVNATLITCIVILVAYRRI